MSTSPIADASAAGLPRRTLSPFRLRRHADFQKVYAASRKGYSASFAYFFRLRVAEEIALTGASPRVGLTVPRALGGAVVRNRIKRRMREAVRLELGRLHAAAAPQLDIVLHPRKLVAEMNFKVLEDEMVRLFEHLAVHGARPQLPPSPRTPRRVSKGGKPVKVAGPIAPRGGGVRA